MSETEATAAGSVREASYERALRLLDVLERDIAAAGFDGGVFATLEEIERVVGAAGEGREPAGGAAAESARRLWVRLASVLELGREHVARIQEERAAITAVRRLNGDAPGRRRSSPHTLGEG